MTEPQEANVKTWNTQTVSGASGLLQDIGYIYNAAATIKAIIALYIYISNNQIIFFGDVFVYLALGYYLPNKKSRSLAVSALLFSILFLFALISPYLFGNKQMPGVITVLVSLLLIYVAIRAIQGTFSYHRLSNNNTNWRNVFFVWLLAIIIYLGFTFIFALRVLSSNLFNKALFSMSLAGSITMLAWIIVSIVTFVLLTRFLPLLKRQTAVQSNESFAAQQMHQQGE